jgi:FixJ family two-component response regulator
MTSKPQTVYIIDDEQDVRDGLQMLLKSIGITAETFPSG